MDDGASADFDATVARLRADGLEVDVVIDAAGRYAVLREPAGQAPSAGVNDEQPASPPPRPTRGLAVGLALVIAAVFAVVALTSTDEPERRRAQPTPTTTEQPTLQVKPTIPPTRPMLYEGPRLLGVRGDWEVFAFTDNEVARIELASGRVTRTPVPALSSSGPVSYLVGPDRALIVPLDDVPGYLVEDGKLPEDLPDRLSGAGHLQPGPAPDQVWVHDQRPDRSELSLRTMNGASAGKRLTLPAEFYPEGSDGRGGVVGAGIGGAYRVGPEGAERITTGRIRAVGPNHFLTQECDERARCVSEVIDRRTGTHRVVDNDVERNTNLGAISSTGAYAAGLVVQGDGEPRLHVIDLATGRPSTPDVTLPNVSLGTQEMAWSPDGRWLLTSSAGELVAVDPETARVRPVGVDVTGVKAVVIRR